MSAKVSILFKSFNQEVVCTPCMYRIFQKFVLYHLDISITVIRNSGVNIHTLISSRYFLINLPSLAATHKILFALRFQNSVTCLCKAMVIQPSASGQICKLYMYFKNYIII